MRTPLPTRRWSPWLAPALLSATCFPVASCTQFDREDRIEDLRVLAVRTEPPEVLYDPIHVFTRPEARPPGVPQTSLDVSVEVIAFEPRGGPVDARVRFCPEGNGACVDYDPEPLWNGVGEPAAGEVRAAYTAQTLESEGADLSRDPSGQVPGLRFSFAMTPAVIDSLVPKTPDGTPTPSFFPTLPRFGIEVESPTHEEVTRETAYKRWPVGLNLGHPSVPPDFRNALATRLGITLCPTRVPDDEYVEGPGTCVEPRVANQNPTLLGFYLHDEGHSPEAGIRLLPRSESGSVDLGPESRLRVPRGGTLFLEPVFADDALERYQALRFNLEGSELEVENRREDLTASWYTTRGDVSLPLTTIVFYNDLSVRWRLPYSSVSAGEGDTLVVVVRDQRGGIATGRVQVEYR